ncbi:MAG: hypothetical protein KIT19_12025 [Phycisphaeraceae bacterium]|nr:hypothetical protein [Phycisphaeraceae bacterium]
MKTALKVVGVLALVAGSASADIRLDLPSNHVMLPASAVQAIDLSSGAVSRGTPVYSSMLGPFSAFAAGSFAHIDDYQSVHPATASGNFKMDAWRFAGGVTAVNGILDFFFLDNSNNIISSFGVALPSAGDFLWTITPTIPADVAVNGRLQIQSRTGTTGRWYMTTTAPVPGTNSLTFGHGSTLAPARYAAFEIQALPTPGAAALLGLGGLMAARRRR